MRNPSSFGGRLTSIVWRAHILLLSITQRLSGLQLFASLFHYRCAHNWYRDFQDHSLEIE